ncbi:dihydroorotate dehydrogenase-like protein [Planctomycetes bacterium K23_9]|uniref:Dihydroorotate dehydrogenase B (NAD(+)), catalytic subunit n=1 Tax=Stieleria marina TaxID=1930275 RepID=A0A517NXN1_9BACT|nr:Dihydroorotate dehydrogenase B (NAD(+)), catalytic subunit [Planctomycetes bacterium K23_9]
MSGQLAVNYLGLNLTSPVVVGACPLTLQPETVRQLASAGAGAIVLPSILQEQLVHRQIQVTNPLAGVAESGYQPQQDKYNGGVTNYLTTIKSLKETCALPIIASLNGASAGDWLDYANEIEDAGADALEFNLQPSIFDPNDASDAIEERLCDMIRQVVQRVTIPVAVKVSQRFTNLASMTRQLKASGAQGVVLFTHLPHWDIGTDRKVWTIRWELSPLDSLGLILEGIVRLRSGQFVLSIAASGGVATAEDAVKAIIAGADVVMVTSAVYRKGPDAVRKMVDGIERHLEMNEFESLSDFKESCPVVELGSEHMMRLEYVDPLTRSDTYFDPTPVTTDEMGDVYGHRK